MKKRKRGSMASRPVPSTKGVVVRAALVFVEHGAKAAREYLGGSLRADELLPKVFAQAKFWERKAKRESPTAV